MSVNEWPDWDTLVPSYGKLAFEQYERDFIQYNFRTLVLPSTSTYAQKVERMKIRLRSGWWEVHCPRCDTQVFVAPSREIGGGEWAEDMGNNDAQWGAMTHIREWHKEQQ